MHSQCLLRGLLAALVFAIPSAAQITLPGGTTTPIPIPTVLQQSFTTGLMGFTTNQTARLNVFNMTPVPSSTTTVVPANCSLALQFFDTKNNQLSQSIVASFAPGASTSFDLPRASVTSPAVGRTEIRGVVVINPTSSTTTSAGFCPVIATLEIFDATTGSTVSSTSDIRSLGGFVVLPATGISVTGQ